MLRGRKLLLMSEVRKQDDLNNARLLQSERIHLSIFYKDVHDSCDPLPLPEKNFFEISKKGQRQWEKHSFLFFFFFTNISSKKIWQLFFLSLFALSFVRFSFFFFSFSLQYNDSFNNEIIWCNNLQFSQIIILHLTLFLLNVSLNFITMNITASIGTVNTIVSIIMPSSSRTSITVINIAVINPNVQHREGKEEGETTSFFIIFLPIITVVANVLPSLSRFSLSLPL